MHNVLLESDGELIKRPRYYYLLEPESTDYSSDGNESIYSIQQRTTGISLMNFKIFCVYVYPINIDYFCL